MRVMRLHGMSKDAWKRYDAGGSWYYEVVAPGFKYNLGDIASALGLVQLRRTEAILRRREAIAKQYLEAFADSDFAQVLDRHDDRSHAWHLFILRLRLETLNIDRRRFIEELEARGIGTSVHFIPLHMHPYYRDTYGYQPDDMSVARDVYERSVSLPIYSLMTDEQVARVIEAVRHVANTHRR